jgi:hypothetical protein
MIKDMQLNFRIETGLKRKLEAVCFAEQEHLSEFIRKAVVREIERRARASDLVQGVLSALSKQSEQSLSRDG